MVEKLGITLARVFPLLTESKPGSNSLFFIAPLARKPVRAFSEVL
jgi:hypothetical protein